MINELTFAERFEACMIGGAIGDAWGYSFENEAAPDHSKTYFIGGRKEPERIWALTDDTQLTMATCETLGNSLTFDPALLAQCFLRYFREKRLSGLGVSTLKALTELEAGMDWNMTGRSGEFAAGNGAAMRIAPFAFFSNAGREDIRNACRITHRNEEAY
ncbi:MAG: ADP-ribosylglycohydrolase family protein, partial [Chitinophagaceae bacterium]|nr:ADP-ribosylglycohydrolase family protein [Chitinophagaceae bacterium]